MWFDRHPALAFCLSMIFSENRIPPVGSKPESKLFRIMLLAAASALQDSDQPVGETEPRRKHFDDISEQGLAQCRLLLFDALKRFGIEDVKNACRFGLNGGAARAAGYQTHLADRGMSTQAANAGGSAFRQIDDNADAALEDEVAGVGGSPWRAMMSPAFTSRRLQ